MKQLFQDIDSYQDDNAPALLVDESGQLHINWHANPKKEVMLIQGDIIDGWEAPKTGCYSVDHIIRQIRKLPYR